MTCILIIIINHLFYYILFILLTSELTFLMILNIFIDKLVDFHLG